MYICYECHQPITTGSSIMRGKEGLIHRSTEVQGYNGAGVWVVHMGITKL